MRYLGGMSTQPLVIDIFSDIICPWCFLGKRRLDAAIAMVPEADVTVRWRPFFLDPAIPKEGIDRRKYLVNKFGEGRLKTLHDPLIAAGQQDDVPYAFDKITRTPNTLDAHRVVRWAGETGVQHKLVEALFVAYWRDGRDVGDHDVLADIANAEGMDRKAVRRDLASDTDKLEVFAEVQQAQSMGVQGVPTFILAQRFGVSGAQSAELLADGIRRAVAKQE
jgi:predicted DsbA family dithiol-disulfide isomerase